MDYSNLIKLNKFQVFLLDSAAVLPWSFTRHPWLVTNKKGTISRWEIIVGSRPGGQRWGSIRKDFCSPWCGSEVFPLLGRLFWPARLLGVVEGEEAEKLIRRTEMSGDVYPYRLRYSLLGPNSNTYIQWLIGETESLRDMLPFNCFGKSFSKKIPKV